MPAPVSATFSAAALVAAHISFLDLIDAGAGPGVIKLRANNDSVLAIIVLDDPCGTVNMGTGQLTFSIDVQEDAAPLGGTATYGTFEDSVGTIHLSLPVIQGAAPVAGFIVMNTVLIVQSSPVEILSATLG
jgi:hypothetical protein